MEIIISQGNKRYHMKADLILKNEVCEQYKVYPTNSPELFIILENNRPLIRERYKLKKRRIDWKQTEGKTISVKTRAEIIKNIELNGQIEKELPTVKSTAKTRRKQFSKQGPTLGEIAKKNNKREKEN
jgi:hypothetical protein